MLKICITVLLLCPDTMLGVICHVPYLRSNSIACFSASAEKPAAKGQCTIGLHD